MDTSNILLFINVTSRRLTLGADVPAYFFQHKKQSSNSNSEFTK